MIRKILLGSVCFALFSCDPRDEDPDDPGNGIPFRQPNNPGNTGISDPSNLTNTSLYKNPETNFMVLNH